MAQAFSYADGPKGLKDPKKWLNQGPKKLLLKSQKKFLLKGLNSYF